MLDKNKKIKREMPKEAVDALMAMSPSDITLTYIRRTFARTNDGPPLASFQDRITVPKGKIGNDSPIRTNAGRYVFNLMVFEKLRDLVPFANEPLNSKVIKRIVGRVTDLLLEEKIDEDIYVDFINRISWLGYSTVTFTAPGFNMEDLKIPPKTKKLKAELLEKHKDAIDRADVEVVSMIEKRLIASAREEMAGSSIMDFFESGARGSFDNNYKNMVLMRGLAPKPEDPSKFDVSLGNLVDGSPPEDQHIGANILIKGAGGRAIETRISGYISKQLTAAFQGVSLGPDGSDCRTPRTLSVKLTKENISMFRFRYVIDRGKLVLITSENSEKYLGQVVRMRSPLYCAAPEICEKCFGRLPYIIGIKNIGLTFNGVGEKLKVLSMKAFHDTTVQVGKIDLEAAISKA